MKVRMKDIADALGISVNAVSIALNNKSGVSNDMRIRILRKANEMGYIETKAKYVRTFSRNNLCVMMQKRYADDLNFYGKILFAVTEEARERGFDTVLEFFNDKDFIIPMAVTERRIAGIIVIGMISDCNIAALHESRIPLVIVDHASLLCQEDSILTDNKLGGFLITKYLLDRGYRKIGFFGDLYYSLSIKERYFGYYEAMRAYVDKEDYHRTGALIERWSVTTGVERCAQNNDLAEIAKKVKSLLELPQAFVCCNDVAAIALMHALQSFGYYVPGDIAVTGFDDVDIAEKSIPRLTTIRVDKEKMGRLAVRRLCHRISNRETPRYNTVMSVELMERDSVSRYSL